MGTLYLVSTPIGNLDDITIRAIKILFSVDYVACEDTRRTGILLDKLKKNFWQYSNNGEQDTRKNFQLISYHQHNQFKKTRLLINFLRNGKSIALVSDAGTPLLSDPGYLLVSECIKNRLSVVPIPGPSSILAALVASGLPPYPFLFVGYPPEKQKKRRLFFKIIAELIQLGKRYSVSPTVIFFVSPHKIISCLSDFIEVFGDQHIVVARELTKVHEEFIRDKASKIYDAFKMTKPRGELTVLFNLRIEKVSQKKISNFFGQV